LLTPERAAPGRTIRAACGTPAPYPARRGASTTKWRLSLFSPIFLGRSIVTGARPGIYVRGTAADGAAVAPGDRKVGSVDPTYMLSSSVPKSRNLQIAHLNSPALRKITQWPAIAPPPCLQPLLSVDVSHFSEMRLTSIWRFSKTSKKRLKAVKKSPFQRKTSKKSIKSSYPV